MVDQALPDVTTLTFERAMDELDTIVRQLETGTVPLEQSVAYYERGEALKRRCEDLLKRAEARVEKITTGPGGTPAGTQPLDDAP